MNRACHLLSLLAMAANACIISPCLAQPSSEYGIDFVRIGDPGNPDASVQQFPLLGIEGWGPIGGVDYAFNLSRTEMTVAQHLEYVRAYADAYPNPPSEPGFTGMWIVPSSGAPSGFNAHPSVLNYPTNISWYHAARYCNWLTNDKTVEPWAFEVGAYDTRTWTNGPGSQFGGQLTHTSGAPYWIPSLDEWTKAMHWDPNKLGPGQGGYWRYPTSSDAPPTGGYPWTLGAQTGAGDYPGDIPRFFDVGSYPAVVSPWGLLDGSGGLNEWVEFETSNGIRLTRGSQNYFPTSFDRLDWLYAAFPMDGFGGLRLASSIPTPSVLTILCVAACGSPRRRLPCASSPCLLR